MVEMKTLNIKNSEVYDLASRLSDHLGVSMTEAVLVSLRQKLEEYETKRPSRAEIETYLSEWRNNIDVQQVRERMNNLYDENGLPN
jgi:hypothetical protein